MQYATLGATGMVVSRLGFGASTFTQGNQTLSAMYKVGAELADQLVGRALEAGGNLFDTAAAYAGGGGEPLRPRRRLRRRRVRDPLGRGAEAASRAGGAHHQGRQPRHHRQGA